MHWGFVLCLAFSVSIAGSLITMDAVSKSKEQDRSNSLELVYVTNDVFYKKSGERWILSFSHGLASNMLLIK